MPTPEKFDYEAYRNRTHEYIKELHDQLGDTLRVPVEGKQMVFVRNPNTIRRVLSSEEEFPKSFADADHKSSSFLQHFKNLVQPLLRNASLFAAGENKRRAQLKRVFLSSKTYMPRFQSACTSIDAWPETDQEEMVGKLHRVVFDQVMVIMAGSYTNKPGLSELFEACQESLSHFVSRYSVPMFDEKVTDADEAVMRRVMEAGNLVTVGIQERAKTGDLDDVEAASMLGSLTSNDGDFSTEELTATMINALFAACEAPIHVIAMLLVELSQQPKLQQKLHAELTTCKDPLRSAMLRDYVMEGFRHFAPVTLVQRSTPLTMASQVDGFEVPPNTPVLVCVPAVHRNEEIFKDANVYNPHRKRMNMVMLKTENTFMTFSGGPRGCPGRHLAFTIICNSLAHVVQQYELVECPNDFTRRIHKFVEFPLNGAYVGLRRRRPKAKL